MFPCKVANADSMDLFKSYLTDFEEAIKDAQGQIPSIAGLSGGTFLPVLSISLEHHRAQLSLSLTKGLSGRAYCFYS